MITEDASSAELSESVWCSILNQTRSIHQRASDNEWDNIEALCAQRDKLMQTFFEDEACLAEREKCQSSPHWGAELESLIGMNHEIRELAKQAKIKLAEKIRYIQEGRKAQNAYRVHANPLG